MDEIVSGDPVVETVSGAVRGRRLPECLRYLGIPYAAAPAGAGRFAEPAPHSGWRGVRDATEPGPAAPQAVRTGFGALDMSPYFGDIRVGGPDYLTLNVWAPSGHGERRPVMVFVHGGGFISGSTRSPLYDGARFARDGVVLVTLTYRLGIAGFLDLPDAPANRGMRDVLAALDWVASNIAAFGGDPTNVTLFGQSAGATIVAAILATGEAHSRIRRAIVQSGNGNGVFDREQAARVTGKAASLLGVKPTVAGFAAVSDEALVGVASQLTGLELRTERRADPLVGLSPFSVVSDLQPAEAVARGAGAGVPLLIGTNSQEGNLYVVPQGGLDTTTERDVAALAAHIDADPAARVSDYRRRLPHASWGEVRAAILGDALFVDGTDALVGAHTAHAAAPLHRYEFAWPSSAVGDKLGAAHTVELPFVFDCADEPSLQGPRALLGPDAPPRHLSAEMHRAWVDYATTGDPGWAAATLHTFA